MEPLMTHHHLSRDRSRHAASRTAGASLALPLAALLCAAPLAHADTPTPPPTGYEGRYFTTADGCTYSRAQAYGDHASWHLLLNASVLGFADAHPGCAAMLATPFPTGPDSSTAGS